MRGSRSRLVTAMFLIASLGIAPATNAADPPGPKRSGFQSAFPPDRSINLFSKANPAPQSQMNDYVGVGFDSSARQQFLPFISVEDTELGPGTRQHLCTSLEDPTCQPDGIWDLALISSGIGNCAVNPDSACVESFTVIKADGTELEGRPVSRIPKDFKELSISPETGFPPGLASWTWRVEGDTGGDQHDYYITGMIQGGGNAKDGKWQLGLSNFFLEVSPIFYEYSNMIQAPTRTEVKTTSIPNGSSIWFDYAEDDCLASEVGVCLHRRAWPEEVRAKLVVRLPKTLTGWLNGRMYRPVATAESINPYQFRLTIEGEPTANIVAAKWMKRSEIPSSVYEPVVPNAGNPFAGMGKGTTNIMFEDSGMENAIEWYQRWAPYLGETAFAVTKTWTLKNVRTSPQSNRCDQSVTGLKGIVATNASAYEGTPPKYSEATGTLDYRVAAPHFRPDGKTPNIGNYGLTLNSELLQCLYGVKTLPSFASIGITNSDGTETVQTVSLKQQGGWVYLNSDNFGFSSPKLSVKLSQPTPTPSPTPTITPTPTPTKIPVIKKAITCVKGKTVKKVLASKCPVGFKKKA